jgi:hypothetical protein
VISIADISTSWASYAAQNSLFKRIRQRCVKAVNTYLFPDPVLVILPDDDPFTLDLGGGTLALDFEMGGAMGAGVWDPSFAAAAACCALATSKRGLIT